jgi:hypothetical protein
VRKWNKDMGNLWSGEEFWCWWTFCTRVSENLKAMNHDFVGIVEFQFDLSDMKSWIAKFL